MSGNILDERQRAAGVRGFHLDETSLEDLPTVKPQSSIKFFALLMHFFHHQTDDRGQITTLLPQAGIDGGVSGLPMLIPNEEL